MLVPRATDQVMLLAYHVQGTLTRINVNGAWRSACSETLKLPSSPRSGPDEWHTWIAFISADRQNVSNSQYLGVVVASEPG